MTSSLSVDGKEIANPRADDIANGFASIKAEGLRSISEISIAREPVTLFAFGHPKEGYTLEIETTLPKAAKRKVTSTEKLLPQEKVVQIFQAFARGDENWPREVEWMEIEGPTPVPFIVKRLVLFVVIFIVIRLILKYVFKLA